MKEEKKEEKLEYIWDFKKLTKEEILEQIKSVGKTNAHNLMGCSEDWYNPYYALKETFAMDYLEKMEWQELVDLLELGLSIGEGLY